MGPYMSEDRLKRKFERKYGARDEWIGAIGSIENRPDG